MKKAVKSTLIWGTTVAVAAGVAVAIAVPVVNAKNKVTYTDPTNGFNQTKDKDLWKDAGFTGQQLLNSLDKTGIADNSLLTKVQYQLSSYLYTEEQKGSIELQRDWFNWNLYTINKDIKQIIETSLSIKVTATIDEKSSTMDALYNQAIKEIERKINEKNDKGEFTITESEKTSLNTLRKTIDDKKTAFIKIAGVPNADGSKQQKGLIDNLDALKNESSDIYNSSSFTTDYPKVLSPLNQIKNKKTTEFNEAKKSFIANYKTQSEGNIEWQKQLSSKYGGAADETAAVDYLVNQQTSSLAWTRYSFKVNSSFTYEQLKSGLFANIIGTLTDKKVVVGADTLAAKDSRHDNDKVYFFGTESRDPKEINLSGFDKIPTSSSQRLVKINNAILGYKQDASNPSKAWTITKDQIKELFTFYGDAGELAVNNWAKVFIDNAGAATDGKDDTTAAIIKFFSDTKDSTQDRSGDLGWTTQLDALKNYYPGFSLGVAAALDQLETSQHFGTTGVTETAFMTNLMSAIKAKFGEILEDNHFAGKNPFKATNPDAVATADQSKFNDQIADFITNMKDSDVAAIGAVIRDKFMGLTGAEKGLPSAIRLDSGTTGTGVFVVNADEAGTHIIRVQTLTTATAISDSIKAELQMAADAQNDQKVITDWSKFISASFTKAGQMFSLLKFKADNTIDTALNGAFDYLKTKENLDKLGMKDEAELTTKLQELITSLKNSESLGRVQDAYRDTLFTWLQGKMDNGLWTTNDAYTITPEEIYNTLLAAEGVTL